MRKFFFLIIVFNIIISSAVASELDLREANVVGISYDDLGDDLYDFQITLIHDDDGEDGYADAWQIETLTGDLLGKRVLTHAHGTVEFTRSQQINIGDTQMLVVRGYDQIHEFGGQIIILNISSGISEKIEQGENPLDFSNYITGNSTNFEELSSSSSDANFNSLFISVLVFPLIIWYKRRDKVV